MLVVSRFCTRFGFYTSISLICRKCVFQSILLKFCIFLGKIKNLGGQILDHFRLQVNIDVEVQKIKTFWLKIFENFNKKIKKNVFLKNSENAHVNTIHQTKPKKYLNL